MTSDFKPSQPVFGTPKATMNPTTGVELIVRERKRQIDVEKFSSKHDDESSGLALAAICYAAPPHSRAENGVPVLWPWDNSWWKPSSYKRDLVKAGALIAAEIDRILREEGAGGNP